jgi:hypothetical protein
MIVAVADVVDVDIAAVVVVADAAVPTVGVVHALDLLSWLLPAVERAASILNDDDAVGCYAVDLLPSVVGLDRAPRDLTAAGVSEAKVPHAAGVVDKMAALVVATEIVYLDIVAVVVGVGVERVGMTAVAPPTLALVDMCHLVVEVGQSAVVLVGVIEKGRVG